MDDPLHLSPLLLLVVPLVWGIYGYTKTKNIIPTTASAPTYQGWPLLINSAVLYALAFNIIFFIQELFLALGKRWLGLQAFLYHNNHNWEGTHPKEELAQGLGAVSILVVGIICFIIALRLRQSTHASRLFWLWMAFQGLAQSVPQFVTAKFAPTTDTGQAYYYLGIPDSVGVFMVFGGIALMLSISAFFSRLLLELAPVGTQKYQRYINCIALWATLIGIVLIVPFRIMPWSRASAPLAVTIITVPMIIAHVWKVKNVRFTDNEVNHKVQFIPIIALVILLLIFQLVLAPGVEL